MAAEVSPVSPRLLRAACRLLAAAALTLAVAGCGAGGHAAPPVPPAPPPSAGAGDAGAERGIASYYASRFHGRRTASGERYDEEALTAAHPRLPFGTRVRITNLANDRSVVVRVNDRGPFRDGRVIDVSRRAARELGFVRDGIADVRIEVLDG